MAFDSLINSVREAVKVEDMLEKFGKLSTDKERVEYVENLACIRDLELGENFGHKSEAKALEFLDQGNTLLSKKNTRQAVKRFTQAVKLSPPTSALLTQSVLARARALYECGSYQDAAEDARRCVSEHLTPLDALGAIQLEARCQLQLGLKTQAEATLQRALQLLRSSTLSNEQKACVAKELAQDMKNTKQLRTKEPKSTATDTIPQLDYGRNPTLPAASAALKLCWTEEKGRQLVANRDIKMGSVLIVERPYAWSLSTEAMAEHCLHCCRLNKAPLPCRQCSTVCYCSEECRQASWQQYHKFECQILDHMTQTQEMSKMALVSYRIVVTARLGWPPGTLDIEDTDSLAKIANSMQLNLCKELEENSGKVDKEFLPNAYSSVYGQVTHSANRTPADLLKRAVTAVFLSKSLLRTPACHVDEHIFAEAILRHLQSCSCNAYQISEQVVVMNNMKNSVDSEIGGSVYPTISLTNHSCSPNVVRLSYGNICVMRALTNIQSGEEILDNYGPHFLLTVKSERQSQLKLQYFFDCSCKPCNCNWPTVGDLRSSGTHFKCTYCGYDVGLTISGVKTCMGCKRKLDYRKAFQRLNNLKGNFELALEQLSTGKLQESLKTSLAHALILEPIVIHPCMEFIRWQQIIRLCWSLLGNVNNKQTYEDD